MKTKPSVANSNIRSTVIAAFGLLAVLAAIGNARANVALARCMLAFFFFWHFSFPTAQPNIRGSGRGCGDRMWDSPTMLRTYIGDLTAKLLRKMN